MQIFPVGGIRMKFSAINVSRKLVEKLIFVVTDPAVFTVEHKRTNTLYKIFVKFTFASKSI